MKNYLLQKFTALDDQVFGQLMRHLGHASAACYRVEKQELVYFFGTPLAETKSWPVKVRFDNAYITANHRHGLPLGWIRPKMAATSRFEWPKGVMAYYPEQESEAVKLVMLVVPTERRSFIQNDLDGSLEIILKRIGRWVNTGDCQNFINETLLSEHLRKLSQEMQMLIDHELGARHYKSPYHSLMYRLLLKSGTFLSCLGAASRHPRKIAVSENDFRITRKRCLSLTWSRFRHPPLTADSHHNFQVCGPRLAHEIFRAAGL